MILIDEQVLPDRPAAELRTEVAGRARRFRRGRRARLAVSAATASVLAGLLFVVAVGGPTSDVRTTTAASTGGEASSDVSVPPELVGTVGDALEPVVEALDDASDAVMPPPTIVPRKPDAPPSTTPLTKAKAKILFSRGEGLFEAMVDGTGERRASAHGSYHARWSPDGTRVALTDDGSIVVVDLATDQRTVVIEGKVGDNALYPAWMPDGRSIVYTRIHGMPEPEQELWLVDIATKATRRLRANPSKPRVGPDRPAVRGDGTITYVCPAQGTAMLCVTDADGQDLGVVPGTQQMFHYDWSPDGRWLAFTAFTGAEGARSSGLVVQRADGSERRVLQADRATSAPAWFPDGSRVIFTVVPPNPESVEGTAYDELEGTRDDGPCEASPCPSDTGIWSIRLDGSDARPIVSGQDAYLQDARRA